MDVTYVIAVAVVVWCSAIWTLVAVLAMVNRRAKAPPAQTLQQPPPTTPVSSTALEAEIIALTVSKMEQIVKNIVNPDMFCDRCGAAIELIDGQDASLTGTTMTVAARHHGIVHVLKTVYLAPTDAWTLNDLGMTYSQIISKISSACKWPIATGKPKVKSDDVLITDIDVVKCDYCGATVVISDLHVTPGVRIAHGERITEISYVDMITSSLPVRRQLQDAFMVCPVREKLDQERWAEAIFEFLKAEGDLPL